MRRLGAVLALLAVAAVCVGCGGGPDPAAVRAACADVAADYQRISEALFGTGDLETYLSDLMAELTQYGNSLGGDAGSVFAAAHDALDSDVPFAAALSPLNQLCGDVDAGPVLPTS